MRRTIAVAIGPPRACLRQWTRQHVTSVFAASRAYPSRRDCHKRRTAGRRVTTTRSVRWGSGRQRERGLRLFFAAIGDISTFVQKLAACAAPLVIIVAAWRLLAAVNLPRAVPATVLAALSHMLRYGLRLVHGFFNAHLRVALQAYNRIRGWALRKH